MAEDAGLHFPFFEFQPSWMRPKSTAPANWPSLNSSCSFEGEEPVSQGRSEVSCNSGNAMTFRPFETSEGKEKRHV
jgi:hypothetical protein